MHKDGNIKTVIIMAHQGAGDLLMMMPMLKALNAELSANDSLFIVVKGRFEASIASQLAWQCKMRTVIIGDGGIKRAVLMLRFVVRRMFSRVDFFIAPLLYNRIPNVAFVLSLRPKISVARPIGLLGNIVTNPVAWHTEQPEHQVQFYNRCLVETGLTAKVDFDVTIDTSAKIAEEADRLLDANAKGKLLVAFGPGATPRQMKKCWPAKYFAELARLVMSEYPTAKIVLFGAPQDEYLFEIIRVGSDIGSDKFLTVSGQSFALGLSVMKKCACMVSGTTGLGHMAAAANIPIIVPCVPTNPDESGPYSDKAWIISADLVCSPCYRDDFVMCNEFECMTLIAPAAVFAQLKRAISGDRPVQRDKKRVTTRAIGYKRF